MIFKDYVKEVLQIEVSDTIKERGYILETDLCTMICKKYNLSMPTVRVTLREIYPQMALIRRRLSDELKRFYGLNVKGCPIVYIPRA